MDGVQALDGFEVVAYYRYGAGVSLDSIAKKEDGTYVAFERRASWGSFRELRDSGEGEGGPGNLVRQGPRTPVIWPPTSLASEQGWL